MTERGSLPLFVREALDCRAQGCRRCSQEACGEERRGQDRQEREKRHRQALRRLQGAGLRSRVPAQPGTGTRAPGS
jgi:hypothetical protein